VVAGEKTPEAEVNKRSSVIRNGIRATVFYLQNGGTEKMKSLLAALQHLESSDLPMAIRLQAKETLLKIRE
jgi:hypothetical protein